MTVELIGLFGTRFESEIHPGEGPAIDSEYIVRLGQAYEGAGYDRVLVGWSSSAAESSQVSAYLGAHTEKLGFLIAHRPGFVYPTVASRLLATLDQLSGGRVALHTITGASDAEQRRDGDWLPKAERYGRTGEFLQILKLAWTSDEPFDFDGKYFQLRDYLSPIKPLQKPRIPLSFAGASDEAFRVGAAEADLVMMYGLPIPEITAMVARLHKSAAEVGRAVPPRFGVSVRPILGPTEDAAWERAYQVQERLGSNSDSGVGSLRISDGQVSQARQNTIKLAESRGAGREGGPLWLKLAAHPGQVGNSAPLVGTPETVADFLMEYVKLGASTLIMYGYDPIDDAVDFGRELIPRLRESIAEHERNTAAEAVAGR